MVNKLLLALLLCAGLALAQASAAPANGPLTNETIINMVRANVPADVIVRTIGAAERVDFRFLPGDLQLLAQYNVPDDVVRAMAAKGKGLPVGGAAPPSAVPAQATPVAPAPQTPAALPRRVRPEEGAAPDLYQGRGMWDADISGFVIIPHIDPSGSTIGSVTGTGGYFVTRGLLVGMAVQALFVGSLKDVYLAGGGRYYFKTGSPKVLPYVGADAGVNVIADGSSTSNFLAQGSAGLRVFVTRHVALDFGYTLEYVHISGASFQESTASAITVGFAHVWGGK